MLCLIVMSAFAGHMSSSVDEERSFPQERHEYDQYRNLKIQQNV